MQGRRRATRSPGGRGALLVLAAIAVAAYAACAASPPPELTTPGNENDPRPAQVAGYAPGVPGFEARRATAQAEIGEAMRTLDTAGDACGLACPAVQHLRVGVRRRCAITEMKDDDKVCKEAKQNLLAIETRLKPSCGLCAPRGDAGAGASAADAD